MLEDGVEGQCNCIVGGSILTVCKLPRVQSRGQHCTDVVPHYFLKALACNGGQCDRSPVIQAFHLGFLWDWDNGGHLKTVRDHSLAEGEVEDVCVYIRQLVRTGPEDTARNVARARGLADIQPFESPPYIMDGDGQRAGVLGCGRCRLCSDRGLQLEPGEKAIQLIREGGRWILPLPPI